MVFTVEPMINAGRRDIREDRGGPRRLDHRHQGPLALGAVGAHGRRHRDRLEVLTVSAGSPPVPAFAPLGYGTSAPPVAA